VFIGILLVCTSADAFTCRARSNDTSIFYTHKECSAEMVVMAKYAAEVMQILARPYCFPIGDTAT